MGLKLPKIKIKAPKITADPVKAVTKYAEGLGNTVGGVVSGVANPVVGSVGGILSQPGSAELLGGVGAAFGVPTMGIGTPANGAAAFVDRKADFAMPQTQDFSQPSNNMMYYIIAGVVAIGAILFFVFKRK